jgi:ankyrin repeat protein
MTALRAALAFGRKNGRIIRTLIEAGATFLPDIVKPKKPDVRLPTSPLHFLAATGDVNSILRLVNKKILLEGRDALGFTALHYAAMNNEADVVLMLAASGVAIDALDSDGYTPLMHAVRSRSTGAVEAFFVKHEPWPDVEKTDRSGETPLFVAVKNGFADIAYQLISHGANVNFVSPQGDQDSVLQAAVYSGSVQLVRSISVCPRLDPSLAARKTKSGITPFMAAVNSGDVEMLREVLELQYRAAGRDYGGAMAAKQCKRIVDFQQSFLSQPGAAAKADTMRRAQARAKMAIPERNVGVAKGGKDLRTLIGISDGLDGLLSFMWALPSDFKRALEIIDDPRYIFTPNFVSIHGITPLAHPLTNGQLAHLKELVRRGGSVGVVDYTTGLTALHKAAQWGQVEIVKFLLSLEPSPDVNALSFMGTCPLHSAAICADARYGAQIAEMLISHPNFARELHLNRDKQRWTPLHYAARGGAPEVIKVLVLSRGFDVNAQNLYGDTPLHIACSAERAVNIRQLLRLGARRDIVNDSRKTPLDIAREKNAAAGIIALLSGGRSG